MIRKFSWAVVLLAVWPVRALTQEANVLRLSEREAERIGRLIWRNECGGRVAGLTSWNQGEDFPSLGIGHFIWYPKGVEGHFEESFPALVAAVRRSGAAPPKWLATAPDCPWNSRAEFLADLEGPRLTELRQWLARTVPQQTAFLVQRAQRAWPKILEAAPPDQREELRAKFFAVGSTPQGIYGLVDYVNFKGEGTNPRERYQGQGWGLLQVLQAMRPVAAGPASAREFSVAAQRVLDRRIALAPRPESQWRAGWFSRCRTYAQPINPAPQKP
jgi:hypothetical protein